MSTLSAARAGLVYWILFPESKQCYVGLTNTPIERRFRAHLRDAEADRHCNKAVGALLRSSEPVVLCVRESSDPRRDEYPALMDATAAGYSPLNAANDIVNMRRAYERRVDRGRRL